MKKKKNNNWIVGLFILVLVGILVLLINFSKGPENDSKFQLLITYQYLVVMWKVYFLTLHLSLKNKPNCH